MKSRQITALLLSAVMMISTCIPVGITAYAEEDAGTGATSEIVELTAPEEEPGEEEAAQTAGDDGEQNIEDTQQTDKEEAEDITDDAIDESVQSDSEAVENEETETESVNEEAESVNEEEEPEQEESAGEGEEHSVEEGTEPAENGEDVENAIEEESSNEDEYIINEALFEQAESNSDEDQNIIDEGFLDSGLKWTLYNNKTLIISGNGPMGELDVVSSSPSDSYEMPYWSYGRPYYGYDNSFDTVIIENGVTNICYKAFFGCYSIKTIVIPDTVTAIGCSAFNSASSIETITIPESVTKIGDQAFADCDSLQECIINGHITTLEFWMFRDCSSLTKVRLPDTLKTIGDSAFQHCYNLKELTIPKNVRNIYEDAFQDCGFEEIHIPEGIGNYGYDEDECVSAINWCSNLHTVYLPSTTTVIYADATFYGCSSLTNVYFNNTSSRFAQIIKEEFPEDEVHHYTNPEYAFYYATVHCTDKNVIVKDVLAAKKANKTVPEEKKPDIT